MNPIEYGQIVERLQKQLNQKGSLIRFHIPSFSEYLSRYPASFLRDAPANNFIVKWSIRVADKNLTGELILTVHFVTDSAFDLTEYIIENIINEIGNAIARPDKVPEAKIVVT